jgi:hypothetical protein
MGLERRRRRKQSDTFLQSWWCMPASNPGPPEAPRDLIDANEEREHLLEAARLNGGRIHRRRGAHRTVSWHANHDTGAFRVDDLDYATIDLAVARAEIAAGQMDIDVVQAGGPRILTADGSWEPFRPTVNVGHAWPIVEREGIAVGPVVAAPYPAVWFAALKDWKAQGPTGLVAAMQVYLLSGRCSCAAANSQTS